MNKKQSTDKTWRFCDNPELIELAFEIQHILHFFSIEITEKRYDGKGRFIITKPLVKVGPPGTLISN